MSLYIIHNDIIIHVILNQCLYLKMKNEHDKKQIKNLNDVYLKYKYK